ncbi:unnamed protein product, partial [Ectocarpus sp. 12 AP-2014]
ERLSATALAATRTYWLGCLRCRPTLQGEQMIGVATSFEPSPFDGLLSSNSIFVSPLDANMAAPDRYGRQHEEQQYNSSSRTKGIDDHEGEDIGDPRGD